MEIDFRTLMGELPTVHAGLMDYTPGGTLCSMATCAGVRTWMSDNATLVWKLWSVGFGTR